MLGSWRTLLCLSTGFTLFICHGLALGQIGGGSGANKPTNTKPGPTLTPPSGTSPSGTSTTQPQDSTTAPKDPDVEKAMEAFKKGDLKACLDILQDAAKRRPELPPAKLMLARICAEANLLQQSRNYLEQSAVENPDHPDIYITMGNIALSEGRLTDAYLHYREGMDVIKKGTWNDTQKKFVKLNCLAGMAAVAEGRATWDKANEYLKQAIDLEPKNGRLRQRYARSLFMIEKRDEAANEFEKAVKDDPTLEPAGITLARLYSQVNNQTKAEEWFQYSAKQEPNNLKVRLGYANWLVDLSRYDDARKQINEALRIDSKSPDARSLLAYVHRVQKNYPEAERIFDELVKEFPNNLYVANQLNLVLISQPDDAKRRRAMESAEALLKKHSNDVELATTMAWVLYKMNRTEEAEKILESIARATGGRITSDGAYYMANVYADRGKLDQVRLMLKGAIDSPGRFAFRKDAEDWYRAIEKKP